VSGPETGRKLLQFKYSTLCTMKAEHLKDLKVKYFGHRERDQVV